MTPTAGLGFKMEHLDEALSATDPGLWFEVHAENYMVDGGPRLAALAALRAQHPISVHGVGLSIASSQPPSRTHLLRLKHLCDRTQPVLVSDHLAWQRWDGVHHADFLPFPRTRAALAHTADNVAMVQDTLGRQLLVENPSLYVNLPGHAMSEAEFLNELALVTGCGLILDVNNVYVSAHNLSFDAAKALQAINGDAVAETHLAGHAADSDPSSPLLIDTHGAPVNAAVWSLYAQLIERIGPRPTLIERDDDIPGFGALIAERNRAHGLLTGQPEYV